MLGLSIVLEEPIKFNTLLMQMKNKGELFTDSFEKVQSSEDKGVLQLIEMTLKACIIAGEKLAVKRVIKWA